MMNQFETLEIYRENCIRKKLIHLIYFIIANLFWE